MEYAKWLCDDMYGLEEASSCGRRSSGGDPPCFSPGLDDEPFGAHAVLHVIGKLVLQ